MIFRFIAARKAEHSIKTVCLVLGVSRSGFTPGRRGCRPLGPVKTSDCLSASARSAPRTSRVRIAAHPRRARALRRRADRSRASGAPHTSGPHQRLAAQEVCWHRSRSQCAVIGSRDPASERSVISWACAAVSVGSPCRIPGATALARAASRAPNRAAVLRPQACRSRLAPGPCTRSPACAPSSHNGTGEGVVSSAPIDSRRGCAGARLAILVFSLAIAVFGLSATHSSPSRQRPTHEPRSSSPHAQPARSNVGVVRLRPWSSFRRASHPGRVRDAAGLHFRCW